MRYKLKKIKEEKEANSKSGWTYRVSEIQSGKRKERMIEFYCNELMVGFIWGKAARLWQKSIDKNDDFSFEKHIWWDDDEDAPTIEPASTVMEYAGRRFHGFIRDGYIEVLPDSSEEYNKNEQ